MKKSVLRAFLFLCLFAGCTAACDWLFPEQEGAIPAGVLFYTGCPVAFYFVDEDGDDLVDFDQPDTYPTVFRVPTDVLARERACMNIQTIRQSGVDYYVYNEGSNWFWKDQDEQKCAFQTYLWGKTVNTEAIIYVYPNHASAADSLHITYKYLTPTADNDLGGSTWGVDVLSVKYNEVEVFEHNETGKVFIVKPSQGETTVKVGSLN
ncbi:MAG: hypothetical protein J5702_01000 [Bacteroidales bacterium]|nr:hypothetical protein [Bacteroidales bacterium]